MKPYTLQVPMAIERKLRKCRASIRHSIAERLQAIVESVASRSAPKPASGKRLASAKSALPQGPPLRFYVLEGYRVSYLVNAITRRVVVLELHPASG